MMKICKSCLVEKDVDRFSKDKTKPDGLVIYCKDCVRIKKAKIRGTSGDKKNVNNLKDAQEWLDQNHPKYKILDWKKGPEKCKIIDSDRNVEFEYEFMRFKSKLVQFPSRTFGLSKEESSKKALAQKIENKKQQIQIRESENKARAEVWLTENFPKYKILEWGGSGIKKSKFLDAQRNIEFITTFSEMKKILSQRPDNKFNLSQQEVSEKMLNMRNKAKDIYNVDNPFQSEEIKKRIKINNIKKYGKEYTSQVAEIRNAIEATRIQKGLTTIINGKTLIQIAKENNVDHSNLNKIWNKTKDEELILNYSAHRTYLEAIVENILKCLNIEYQFNKYLEGTSYKPDFLVESHKLIIECDSFYWHCDTNKKIGRSYHKNKKDKYTELGYSSLFFHQDELEKKPHIVESIIKNKLGLSEKIGARKCTIQEVPNPIAKAFFENVHLMGNGSGRTFGLYYQNELVCATQVRWKKKGELLLDISRFATKLGVNVVGGFTRLLNHIEKEMKPNKIMTFIDQRYGRGDYLTNLGFVKENCDLSFCWVSMTDKFHRMSFKKNSGYEHGLFKLWDCGQAKWIKEMVN